MTLEHFKAHREGIASNMRANLLFAKATNTHIQPYVEYTEYHSISIYKEDHKDQVLGQMEAVYALAEEPRARLTQEALTQYRHCTKEFIGTSYTIATPKLRTHITDEQIQDAMKELVKQKLGLTEWDTLECRVMDLYKQGVIGWDKIVEAHQGSCDL